MIDKTIAFRSKEIVKVCGIRLNNQNVFFNDKTLYKYIENVLIFNNIFAFLLNETLTQFRK